MTDTVTMGAELVVDARNLVGESPVWVAAQQSLYWVDIAGRRLYRWSCADDSLAHWSTPEMTGCIAPHAQGGWLCAMETGLFHLRPGPADALQGSRVARVDHALPGMRFNDGRCDRQGRFRAGTMLMDMAADRPVGCLYSLEADGTLACLQDGLLVPNGLAFSPDGRTMYLSDSHPRSQQIWAFDYDTDTGRPGRRRLFVDMKPLAGRPDGAAVDADGCYWTCANDAGLVHRFTPAGRLDYSLEVPVGKPSMCAFGGPGLDTLFVTSIRPAGNHASQPLAGGVFALRPGVRGLPEPAFRPSGLSAVRQPTDLFHRPHQGDLHVEQAQPHPQRRARGMPATGSTGTEHRAQGARHAPGGLPDGGGRGKHGQEA